MVFIHLKKKATFSPCIQMGLNIIIFKWFVYNKEKEQQSKYFLSFNGRYKLFFLGYKNRIIKETLFLAFWWIKLNTQLLLNCRFKIK